MYGDLFKAFYEEWHKKIDSSYSSEHFLLDIDLIAISLLGAQNRIL